MRIAIVARGDNHQSLASQRGHIDCVIGINHAAAMHHCDWWCYCDHDARRDIIPLGHPRESTHRGTIHHLASMKIPAVISQVWEEMPHPDRDSWMVFSSTAALVLAKHLGATEIQCFGIYTINNPTPIAGEDARWIAERRIWNQVVNWLDVPVVKV